MTVTVTGLIMVHQVQQQLLGIVIRGCHLNSWTEMVWYPSCPGNNRGNMCQITGTVQISWDAVSVSNDEYWGKGDTEPKSLPAISCTPTCDDSATEICEGVSVYTKDIYGINRGQQIRLRATMKWCSSKSIIEKPGQSTYCYDGELMATSRKCELKTFSENMCNRCKAAWGSPLILLHGL